MRTRKAEAHIKERVDSEIAYATQMLNRIFNTKQGDITVNDANLPSWLTEDDSLDLGSPSAETQQKVATSDLIPSGWHEGVVTGYGKYRVDREQSPYLGEVMAKVNVELYIDGRARKFSFDVTSSERTWDNGDPRAETKLGVMFLKATHTKSLEDALNAAKDMRLRYQMWQKTGKDEVVRNVVQRVKAV